MSRNGQDGAPFFFFPSPLPFPLRVADFCLGIVESEETVLSVDVFGDGSWKEIQRSDK